MRGEGREKLLQTAIFSERQELTTRSRPTTPAPRKTPSTQWLKGSEWEWEGVGRRGIEWAKVEKTFRLFRVFVATSAGKQLGKMAMLSACRWMTFAPVVNTTTTTRAVQIVQVVFIDFTNPGFGRQSALTKLELQVIWTNIFWQLHQFQGFFSLTFSNSFWCSLLLVNFQSHFFL